MSTDRRNRPSYSPKKNRQGLFRSLEGQLKYEVVPIEVRLYAKILREVDGCWIWRGRQSKNGYGQFRVNGHLTSPHRVMYMLAYGTIPLGQEIDHLCRVRNCVNPDHLRAVDHRTNQLNRGSSN